MKNIEKAYEFFNKGQKLYRENNFLKAVMLFEKAKKLEPEKGSIREALATAYYNCGFYKSAMKNFKKALEIDSTNDFAHYGIGLCLVKEGKTIMALGHFKLASAMKPDQKNYIDTIKRYQK